ncbi:MAG: putative metal-binding motif-containing protein [Patescibacteria group bacterium]|jgi:hypothetical protein
MRFILAAFLALFMAGCLPPWPGVDTGDPVVDTDIDSDTDTDSDSDTDTDVDTDSDTDTDTDADTDSDTDTDTDTDTGDTGIDPVDVDDDGWTVEEGDCNDEDATINPDAAEYCDLVDNDCDGTTDEADAIDAPIWFFDGDEDGYGDPDVYEVACDQPPGFIEDDTDCDDSDPAYHPGATEDDCTDPNDYNCDGSSALTDADTDGWAACEDCDDLDATINPGAAEVCDDLDQDCDGTADDGIATIPQYQDLDGDGHGNALVSTEDCAVLDGYVTDATDCDDTNAAINPDEVEVCDGVDQDCDGTADDGLVTIIQFQDSDGDGFGDAAMSIEDCEALTGYVTDATDCDDTDATINPDADEYCDLVDNDCDGTTDEADSLDATTWYVDVDGDGYGDSTVSQDACDQPTGYVEDATDCDDLDATINPGAAEVCDDLDQDCDGTADDGIATIPQYQDLDGDGHGNALVSTEDCAVLDGYVTDATDCDDTNAAINPDEVEVCDGVDQDCDGTADDGLMVTQYRDADSDGYGDPLVSTEDCAVLEGYVTNDDDCDDTDAAYHPGADESNCSDPADYNCDGSTGWADADSDGSAACDDCNDGDASIYPGATETCDGVDEDCDGVIDNDLLITQSPDTDSDGYGDASISVEACTVLSGYVEDDSDCDDTDAEINPGAEEICDSLDNNCDGATDEGFTYYVGWPDEDSDSYGDPEGTQASGCPDSKPDDYVLNDDDCDDTDAAVYPGATETCDGVDEDCDGTTDEADALDATTWYADADEDGYGSSAMSQDACDQPTGYIADNTDCDDADAAVYPGATETCDGIDEDCSGTADDIWDCEDVDSDGILNSEDLVDLIDADGDGGIDACVPGFLVLASPYSEASTYLQFGTPYTALVDTRALNGDVDDDGVMDSWCVTTDDFATGAGSFRLVSTLSASNPLDPVGTTDCADWKIPSFTAYCSTYSECCTYNSTAWDGCRYVRWEPYVYDNGTDLSCP